MKRLLRPVTAHPRISAAVGVVLAVLVVFVFYWFQPHKLFIDDVVNETSEVSLAAAGGSSPAGGVTAAPAGVKVGPVGRFEARDHPATGMAAILINADGTRTLRIEDLDTDNGPDLRVVLSPAAADQRNYDELIELGRLKGNKGSQSYDIPASVDLSRVKSVVIWCERFGVAFGEAPVSIAV